VPGLAAAVSPTAQTVVFKTDVLALTFDLQGAQLIRTDLLAFPSVDDPQKPFTLLERTTGHTYVVQSGLTGASAGVTFPNHLVPFTLETDARELKGDTLVIKFSSTSGDVKLTKTYTLKRGNYAIDVTHQI
jgi:YidC/Oxa1 family membrane protein insertase